MATLQEDILRQTGVTLPDGRRFRNGALISAGDAASTDATTARNAALDSVARGQAIQTGPRPSAPVISDAQLATLPGAPAKSPLGDSPVAKAVHASLASSGDVNSYSGSQYGTAVPVSQPGQPISPGSPQPGYGATRSDPGMNVNSWVGSMFDQNFAANNPGPKLDAPEIALAKAMLKASQSTVPGRVYNDQTLAAATPQQVQIEAALLPQRQQQATNATETAALQEAFQLLKGNAGQAGTQPSEGDVTAALGRPPGSQPAAPGTQLTAPPDIAAAVLAYVNKGGKDPKRIEEIRQTGEAASKASAPGKPVPGSAGYTTIPLPDGGSIVRDNATGAPLSNSEINRPTPKEGAKPAEAEINFETNISQAQSGIKQLRDVINRSGTWESGRLGNSKDAALLDQLPYQLAIQMAKIADPGSVAREGEVAAAQKYLIPTGFWANKSTALAAIDNLEQSINGYAKSRKDARGVSVAPSSGTAAASARTAPAITPAAAAAELARRRSATK